ncbi:hypothetical protein CANARDRAFT_5945 [[Candida] arabinofermentans NRRL YB-2248]|uniref:Uncharacterized protein n=1 Tax=[Candida] arabinofermentans NRRL YB-2248 TaxID=983967 RepID=A0A1E4T6L8_9ASCO|nr:hypothetical protein CANARDRAFT_5945 [[Candida] arabinofermentans NRRL YB-2248]
MRPAFVLSVFSFLLLHVLGALLSIDYGQEFTKAVLVAPGVPFDIILTADTKRKDMSGLAITTVPGSKDEVQRNFGSHALSSCVRNPSSCLLHLKSIIGKSVGSTEAVKYLSTHPSVDLVESKNSRNSIAFKVAGTTYPVEELLAMTFEETKARAEQHWDISTGSKSSLVTDVVITVPSFFTQSQRLAIKDAAEIAGLNVVALVDDGLAVALNYASTREFNETKQYHLIYDMGAGSTKATLVSLSSINGTLQVENEGYGYDETLGGHLFTESIKDILEAKFLSEHKNVKMSKLSSNGRAMNRLWQAADKAKLVLSANSETKVSIESFYDDIDFKTVVTREEFEEYIGSNIHRFTKPLIDAIGDFDLKNISSVILAGGSTRVPIVQKHLVTYLGSEDMISKNVNADEAHVLGATLRGLALSGMFRTKQMNIIEHSLSSYEIKYFEEGNQKKPSQDVVVPKGSTSINNRTAIELKDLKSIKGFEVELFEDGQSFKSFSFQSPKGLNESSCPGGVNYSANFELSESRIFDLKSVSVLCYPEPKEPVKGEEVEEVKPKRTVLNAKPKYTFYRPMGTATKQTSINRLRDLTKHDKERQLHEETINKLEASLYDLRAYLEDEEVVANGPPSLISAAQALLTEYLDWLDYDASSATTKEVQEKYDEVRVHRIKIETYVNLSDTLLDFGEFERLYNTSTETIYNLQDFVITMREDALDIQTKYEENNLDFEEANKKVKVTVPQISDSDINSHIEKINEFLELFETFKNDRAQFGSTSKELLYNLRETILDELKELKSIHSSLKSVHHTRIQGLKDRLNKYLKRKEKEEKKLASSAISSASQATASEEETATESISATSETSATTTHSDIKHDEL